MELKDKILTTITAHPRLLTFGIGIAVTFTISAVIAMIADPSHAANAMNNHHCTVAEC